ncbi:hypothetical protein AAG570_001184 [Ranatra chinensis]|uniref:GPI alpha-1,4-mannosyltransferase I, catalytic subunit n=1 Tax=Ranatra chinensis TaxID=642074 RepID=A0ABD0YB49_9HEMI
MESIKKARSRMLQMPGLLKECRTQARSYTECVLSRQEVKANDCVLIRCVFILYGAIQDCIAEVPFTDVDYRVFTDSARHVLEGKSPYMRHTYRYSPLVALILLPNVILHPVLGKILFSVFDIFIGFIIYKILMIDRLDKNTAAFYSCFWLYNPLSIVISTRGNADSLSALLVLWTLLEYKSKRYVQVGVIHGLAIHLRIYPIVFSLPLYICIGHSSNNKLFQLFYPNKKRLSLIISCVMTLLLLTTLFYLKYGKLFIDESIMFHIRRSDIRHNYSVYFYIQYLGSGSSPTQSLKFFMLLPQIVLFLAFSLAYRNPRHLPFCEFCLAFVLVSYNSVLTCQYFVWYLCLLPLCLPHLSFTFLEALFVSLVWFVSQIVWLLPAYLLEFKSVNTFTWIWVQGLVFFGANIFVLSRLVKNYNRTTRSISQKS